MKSKARVTGKIFNPTVHTTGAGAKLYSFSMGLSQQDKKTQEWLSVYLPITIFDNENRHEWILGADKQEITCEGQLTIKPGYTKGDGTVVANHVAIFGFEASLGEKLTKTAPQETIQAPKAPEVAQTQAHNSPEFPDMSDGNNSVPF